MNPNISNSSRNISRYNLIREDRSIQRGGGVCAFVNSNIPFTSLPDLCCANHKSLWLRLRPFCLPGKFSCFIVGVKYHPPSADNNELYESLVNSLDKIIARYPLAGVINKADFNQFDAKRLCRNTALKQVVKNQSKNLTNMKHWYNTPEILPAIGQSDLRLERT